uniref:Uncharacterized protein n=1 Tax=Anopheles quadriannulatus TaxID=34691 RepID=A0A182XR48_ANOQN
MQRTESELNKE